MSPPPCVCSTTIWAVLRFWLQGPKLAAIVRVDYDIVTRLKSNGTVQTTKWASLKRKTTPLIFRKEKKILTIGIPINNKPFSRYRFFCPYRTKKRLVVSKLSYFCYHTPWTLNPGFHLNWLKVEVQSDLLYPYFVILQQFTRKKDSIIRYHPILQLMITFKVDQSFLQCSKKLKKKIVYSQCLFRWPLYLQLINLSSSINFKHWWEKPAICMANLTTEF